MADEWSSHRSTEVRSISASQFSSFRGPDFVFVDAVLIVTENEQENQRRIVMSCTSKPKLFSPDFGTQCEGELVLDVVCKAVDLNQLNSLLGQVDQLLFSTDCTVNELSPILLVSQDFLLRHDLVSGQVVWVRKLTPQPLSRIVLSLHIADTDIVTRLSRYLYDNRIVVRETDVLTVPVDCDAIDACQENVSISNSCINVEVLQCEPVLQGVLDAHTSIVIDTCKCSLEGDQENEDNTVDDEESFDIPSLLVVDLTLLMQEIDQKTTIPVVCRNQSYTEFRLKVNIDDWVDCHHSMVRSETCSSHLIADDTNRVYVSVDTLMDMNVLNGSWVNILIQDPNLNVDCKDSDLEMSDNCQGPVYFQNETRMRCHIAQIFAVDPLNAKKSYSTSKKHRNSFNTSNFIYISPLLYFNLLNDPMSEIDRHHLCVSTLYGRKEYEDVSQLYKVGLACATVSTPSFAQEVHISMILTPSARQEDSFIKLLTQHFSIPRLLTVGDVICVKCEWQQSEMSGLQENLKLGRSIVYNFKVVKLICSTVEGGTCFVDTKHTSLYQKGAVHSYVPVLMEPFTLQGSHCWKSISNPPGLTSPLEELESIIKPYLSKRKHHTPSIQVLLTGSAGTGKMTTTTALSRRLHLPTLGISCYDLIGDSVSATETRIRTVFCRANACRPCMLLLHNIHALGKDREGHEEEPRIAATMMESISNIHDQSNLPMVIIATSSAPDEIACEVHSCFLHVVRMGIPAETDRVQIMRGLASTCLVSTDVSFGQLSKRTAGFVLADFVALFSCASSVASRRVLRYYNKLRSQERASAKIECTFITSPNEQQLLESDICSSGVRITMQDFQEALGGLQAAHSDAIGAPKIPDVSWQDVGGLSDIKAEILDTIQLPLEHPELFAAGLRRSGVLLYGPPGTGKTLLAKAVATECSLNFLSVKGPELINMYVGQSEHNVREVFSRAQTASPCVIFFDELDSLAPNRGRSGDSGGVMDRVVSQLLAELDGLHNATDVFVIGATNRPDLLDPALLRPGRFDKLLYLGVSEDRQTQLCIMKALTRKFLFAPGFRLDDFVNECPMNLTGADLYALCSDAMLHAMKRMVQTDQDHECENDVQVNGDDFLAALEMLTPSVSVQELERYAQIRRQFVL